MLSKSEFPTVRPANFPVAPSTMNNFCLRYLKNNNTIRTISNIFKTYKKSCENFFRKDRIKRNQSEPLVTQQRPPNDDLRRCKPKSEVDLPSSSGKLCGCSLKDWSNSRFDDNSSQDSLKITWSNSKFATNTNTVPLSRKNSLLDLNVQEKLNQMPMPDYEDDPQPSVSLKRAYPWQNFNIGDDRRPTYDTVRDVDSLTDEMMNFRKSILRKSEPKSLSALKEVKFNRMASMMVYPKHGYGVMKQSRINLSTNVGNGDKPGPGRKRKVKDASIGDSKLGRLYAKPPGYVRKGARGKEKVKKCTQAVEHSNFWYFNKKQKIC